MCGSLPQSISMAKVISAQRALEIIFPQRELVWKERLPLWKIRNFPNNEDPVSVNSESDSELKEEDEIDPQPNPGPARQQPAHQQPAGAEMGLEKNCGIAWASCPRKWPPRLAANVIRMQPGPTWMAVTHVQDIKSSFELIIPEKIAKYGTMIWAPCDAASSYVWNLQVYMGEPDGGAPENIQGMRVVLDVTWPPWPQHHTR